MRSGIVTYFFYLSSQPHKIC